MPELTPDLAPQVIAACTENAEEAAGAFGRAFDGEFVLRPGESAPHTTGKISGPGLVFAFKFGEEHAVAAMPAGGSLVPEWTQSPDPTGESKLSTLAQELSMLLMPDTLMADVFEARWTDDLAAALELSQPAGDATGVEIEVAASESLGGLTLVWPVADSAAALGTASPSATEEDPAESGESVSSGPKSTVLRGLPPARDFRDLPPNTLSALQVRAELSVQLAGKKMSLSDVIELGPGSIVTFDKACDAPLEIAVGDRPIAHGEAVKVGERFGVRVVEMLLPDEHFRPMLPPRAG